MNWISEFKITLVHRVSSRTVQAKPVLKTKNKTQRLGTMVHTFNSSTWEAEAGGSV